MLITNKDDPNFEFSLDYFQYLIDTHAEFDEEDKKMFLECCELYDEREYDEPRRWSRFVTSICKLNDRYYVVEWDQGLTEMQEDYMLDGDIYEVEPYEETIIVKRWRRVEK